MQVCLVHSNSLDATPITTWRLEALIRLPWCGQRCTLHMKTVYMLYMHMNMDACVHQRPIATWQLEGLDPAGGGECKGAHAHVCICMYAYVFATQMVANTYWLV